MDRRSPLRRAWLVSALVSAEDIIYVAVAVVLVAVAGVLLYHTVADALSTNAVFSERITAAVNGVLFVVIVLELFRTVIAHLQGGGFQLRPFLIIGIISAVRHVLLVGARSLSSGSDKAFNHTQIELGVNGGVALVLVIALVLLIRSHDGSNSGSDD